MQQETEVEEEYRREADKLKKILEVVASCPEKMPRNAENHINVRTIIHS